MAVLAWVMMGLAIWHFTIFLPDRGYGGIVGAFMGALLGSFLFGLLINGLAIPTRQETHVLTALEAIPGAVLGIGIMYALGLRQERTAARPAQA